MVLYILDTLSTIPAHSRQLTHRLSVDSKDKEIRTKVIMSFNLKLQNKHSEFSGTLIYTVPSHHRRVIMFIPLPIIRQGDKHNYSTSLTF